MAVLSALPSYITKGEAFYDNIDRFCSNCIIYEGKSPSLRREERAFIELPTCKHKMCNQCMHILVNISEPGEYVAVACNVCWLVYGVRRLDGDEGFHVRPCESTLAVSWYPTVEGGIEAIRLYDFSPLCDVCSLVEAQHFCRDDHLKFCSKCWRDYHLGQAHVKHASYTDALGMCKVHRGKPIIYRCTSHDCKKFSCELCSDAPEHHDHQKQSVDYLFTHMCAQLIKFTEIAGCLLDDILGMKDVHLDTDKARKASYDKRMSTLKTQSADACNEHTESLEEIEERHQKIYVGHTTFRKIRFGASLIVGSMLYDCLQKVKDLRAFVVAKDFNIYKFISRAHELLQRMCPNRLRVFSNTFTLLPCANPSTVSHNCHRLEYLLNDFYHFLRPSDQETIICAPMQFKFKLHQEKGDERRRFHLAIASRLLDTSLRTSYQCTLDVAICQLDETRSSIVSIYEEAAILVVLTNQCSMALLPIWVGDADIDFRRVELHFRLARCNIKKASKI